MAYDGPLKKCLVCGESTCFAERLSPEGVELERIVRINLRPSWPAAAIDELVGRCSTLQALNRLIGKKPQGFPGVQASKPAHRKTVSIDFDGVIHGYSRGWADGTCYDDPVPGAFDFIRQCMERYCVFVLTTRDVIVVQRYFEKFAGDIETVARSFPDMIFWNLENQVLITNRKLAAEWYIDDRAIRFRGDWTEVRDLLPERPWKSDSPARCTHRKPMSDDCPDCSRWLTQHLGRVPQNPRRG